MGKTMLAFFTIKMYFIWFMLKVSEHTSFSVFFFSGSYSKALIFSSRT